MSFTCGLHGWRHAISPCPSYQAMQNVKKMPDWMVAGMAHHEETKEEREKRLLGMVNAVQVPDTSINQKDEK